MKLIKPSYEIITPINGEEILKQIELAARTCYKSEGKIEYEEFLDKIFLKAQSARILIPKLIKNGHHAMLEFGGTITVKFICDRGVSHELVRHRLASFAQESTRYCNYGKDEHVQFIIPCWIDMEEIIISEHNWDDIEYRLLNNEKLHATYIWLNTLRHINDSYLTLLRLGWFPQQARSVLPNSLKTEINVSANIREWRHIFEQRTAKAAHPQMRELMMPLLKDFQLRIPILFDDIKIEE